MIDKIKDMFTKPSAEKIIKGVDAFILNHQKSIKDCYTLTEDLKREVDDQVSIEDFRRLLEIMERVIIEIDEIRHLADFMIFSQTWAKKYLQESEKVEKDLLGIVTKLSKVIEEAVK